MGTVCGCRRSRVECMTPVAIQPNDPQGRLTQAEIFSKREPRVLS